MPGALERMFPESFLDEMAGFLLLLEDNIIERSLCFTLIQVRFCLNHEIFSKDVYKCNALLTSKCVPAVTLVYTFYVQMCFPPQWNASFHFSSALCE